MLKLSAKLLHFFELYKFFTILSQFEPFYSDTNKL